MRAARIIFLVAGLYGLAVLIPGLLTETAFSAANPPALTHPEFYYGFYGSALVWQLVFLTIARAPAQLRLLMPLAMLEKLAFFLPSLALYAQGRMAFGPLFIGALIDGALCLAFGLAWWLSRPARGA